MHNNLGLVIQRQGKIQEAIDHYRMALEFQPNNIHARYNLSNALQLQGKFA